MALTPSGEHAARCLRVLNEWWTENRKPGGALRSILGNAYLEASDFFSDFFKFGSTVRVVTDETARYYTDPLFPRVPLRLLNVVTEAEVKLLLTTIKNETGLSYDDIRMAEGYHKDPNRWDFVGSPNPLEQMLARRRAQQ